ncbi:DEAD/DEAH box helicase [Croceibacterium sp. TMG7-5b_MA50]|uniref:DEAD/DEAH box helicase n=1 Tax=Croceibacterium sp. TMG7-5b_MA50 TaxID=3121290 RepID=UPI0032220A34
MTFNDLPPTIGAALAAQGYSEPTEVQAAVLQDEAVGRDLIVSARTGSGKTVAFGLAMAGELLDGVGRVRFGAGPLALIIAPTRELALQVSRELEWLYAQAGARIATCVGGMNPQVERRTLQQGVSIVVGTPGRLRDHLERGALDLSALKVAVLDEADEMLDMGFREDLEEILDATPADRRTLLFSATMPRPIVALAGQYQRDALAISTIGEERGHGDIAYQAVPVAPAEIENAVVNLLRFHEAETAILFCATRDNVRRMHATLQERGFAVVALSGEHSQSERNQALQALRDGRARVCVATDVAARGIDLPGLSLVVHVEVPRDAETLQHRSGRTGRAGRKGTAVLVVPYPRRRRVEMLLRTAGVQAEWRPAPGPAEIRAQDRDRLIERLTKPVAADEEDRALAVLLQERLNPDDIAAALVRAHRASMPEPEELTPDLPREARERTPRAGFEDVVWFRIDVGRRQNADPRWLLPLLCRRGHVARGEIGAIRIGQRESFFQVPTAIADRFANAIERTAGQGEGDDGGVRIEAAPEGPGELGGAPRRQPGKPFHRGKAPGGDRPPFKGPHNGGGARFGRKGEGNGPRSKGFGGKGRPQRG